MRLSPNQTRLAYDLLVLGLSGAAALCFDSLLVGTSTLELLLLPLIGAAFLAVFGIYGRNRAASAGKKTLLLTQALMASILFAHLVKLPFVPTLLWSTIAWGPLVLPRIFLAFQPRPKLGRFAQSLNEILAQRGPVLVVGGAGYIGSHVVTQLLAQFRPVRVLDRFYYGREALQGLAAAHPHSLELIEGDVTDISRLVQAVDGCSAIVHLAGIVGDPACAIDERTSLHCNIVATKMLYEVARSFGVPRFVFASSCSVYGSNPDLVNETSPLNPVSLYARTKIESEGQLLAAIDDYFFVTILRFATVFGHSLRPRFDLVANLFAAQAFTQGKIAVHGGGQKRPFVHAADVGRAVLLTLNADPNLIQGQVYNVGDERMNTTIEELAQLVARTVGKFRPVEIELHAECKDARDYNVSFEKIRRHLGFRSTILLEDGIAEIVDNLSQGTYQDYRSDRYNNYAITKRMVADLQDPQQSANLYAPFSAAQK